MLFDRVVPDDDINIDDFELRELVIGLYLEKKNASEILNELISIDNKKYSHLTPNKIGLIIRRYEDSITQFVVDNPNLLDKKLDLIMRNVESYDKVEKELWSTYHLAKDAKSKTLALGNLHKTVSEKVKLQQLLGNDKELQRELRDVRDANHKLVLLVKEVTHDCPRCKARLAKYLSSNIRII